MKKTIKSGGSVRKKKVMKILVRDSFHTMTIQETLQNHFGTKAVCYAHSAPPRTKIDVFFLSGKDILSDGAEILHQLKKDEGSKNCKVIAVSVLPEFLERIKNRPELGVDGTIGKGTLVQGLDNCEEEGLGVVLERILNTDRVNA